MRTYHFETNLTLISQSEFTYYSLPWNTQYSMYLLIFKTCKFRPIYLINICFYLSKCFYSLCFNRWYRLNLLGINVRSLKIVRIMFVNGEVWKCEFNMYNWIKTNLYIKWTWKRQIPIENASLCIQFYQWSVLMDSGTIVFTSKIVFSINEQLTIVFRAVDNCLQTSGQLSSWALVQLSSQNK